MAAFVHDPAETERRTRAVDAAFDEMIAELVRSGVTVLSAIKGGALEWSRIDVAKKGAELAAVEAVLFRCLHFVPTTLREYDDYWHFEGSQKWTERVAEPWTKTEYTGRWRVAPTFEYHLPSVTSLID